MRLLSIVELSLRTAARRPRTWWLRLGVASATTVLFVWSGLIGPRWFPALGRYQGLLHLVSAWTFLLCFMAGVHATADSLSREKREDTLGLLFLTGLKAPEIVFGKFLYGAFDAIYGLLAAFPILAMVLLWGGLNAIEFGKVVLALTNTLFFSLSVGLLASAIERKGPVRVAIMLTLGFTVFPPVLQRTLGTTHTLTYLVGLFSPYDEWRLAFEPQFVLDGARFWWTHLCTHVLGWVFLGLASWFVACHWQSSAAAPRLARWRKALWFGRPASRALLNRHPMLWLWHRRRSSAIPGLILIAVSVSFGLSSLPGGGRAGANLDRVLGATAVLQALFKVWVAWEAACCFVQDRRDGTLETLLTTPLRVGQILHDQWLWLQRRFFLPFAVILVTTVVLLVRGEGHFFVVMSLLLLLPDSIALGWVALWLGIRCTRPATATFLAVTQIMIVPAVLPLGLMAFGFGSGDFEGALVLWFILSLMADGFCGWAACLCLQTQFRKFAPNRLSARLG